MYACRVSRDRDRLLLHPTFGTLSGFWLLVAIPIVGVLLGSLIWLNIDAPQHMEVTGLAFPLFIGMAGLAIASLVIAVGDSPFPLVLDRVKGLKRGSGWIPTSDMTSIRVENDPEVELGEHFHLWVHLRNGDRVELKRSLWLLESDHDRVYSIGGELAEFLDVPLVDCSIRLTPEAVPDFTLSYSPAASGHQA
jgi:hypothetical protein